MLKAQGETSGDNQLVEGGCLQELMAFVVLEFKPPLQQTTAMKMEKTYEGRAAELRADLQYVNKVAITTV